MKAFDDAMAFTTARASALALPVTQLQTYAQEEASFGRITVDERGLTAGTKLHVLQPARALLAAWMEARSGFDAAIEPKMADIRAVERLQIEIEALKERRTGDVAQIEQTWEANQEHRAIRRRWDEAETVFNQARLNNGMRDARMTAHQPIYWIAMFCIGIAEWLINYDTFFHLWAYRPSLPVRPLSSASCSLSQRTATGSCSSSGPIALASTKLE
jgi:hypothetical protein